MVLPLIDLSGVWYITYFVGLAVAMALSLGLMCYNRRLPSIPSLLWLTIAVQALFILEWPSAHFGPYTQIFQSTAGQALVEILIIPVFVFHWPELIRRAAPLLALFSAACVWFGFEGFFHAPSFNSAFACLCLPLIVSPAAFWFIVVTAVTHHGSTALLMLFSMEVVAVLRGESNWRFLFLMGFVASVSAVLFQHQLHFNSGERLEKWIEYMTFWAGDWKRVTFGAGPGSFIWYSIMTHKYQTGVYLQMHSDWLQILWENGVVGFTLALSTCIVAVKRAWGKDIKIISGLIAAMVFAATYQPLRYFPSALLTAYFFYEALIVEDVQIEFARVARSVESHY